MKNIFFSLIKCVFLGVIVFLSACNITEEAEPTQTDYLTATAVTDSLVEPSPIPLPTTTETLPEPTRTVTVTVIMETATSIPTPTVESTPNSVSSLGMTTASYLLEGPLIAYRVQNGNNYLLLLDVGTFTLREVRQEHLEIPFRLNWLDSGCHLYARGDVIDLHGNIVEKTNDPENGEAHFQVQLLSPDKKMGVRELFLGQQEDVELEYLTLEILDRTDPNLQIALAPNGGAYAYAWSPDGSWLAFTDFDENTILQVYRTTPDGQNVEQLTSHLEDPGVIQIIEWSPDGQHIAYAAQAFLPDQYRNGGWISLVSLSDLRTVAVKPDYFQYAKGLWWSKDSDRIAFVGESFSDAPDAIQGTQMYWVNRDSGTVINSFYQDQAPTKFFNLVVPLGNLDTIFFEAMDGYYLLDATTNAYKKVLDDIPTDGLIRDFATSPFDFTGEANCLSD